MTISDLNLILKEIDSSKRWAEIVEKQKQEHLNNARDVSARNYFLNMEPSFYAPAWSSMMIVSQLDSGNLIGGRFVQGSWHSDYRVLSIPELQKSGFTDDQIEEILRLADTPM